MDIANSLLSLFEGNDICLSGGAEGADLQWGAQAGIIGHSVIHWSFQGHRSQAPETELVQLTPEQLAQADDAVARANKTLKRRWPSNSDFTNNLLRRNWYQVKDAQAVYAISTLDRKNGVSGGTAWAVQMYLDRFLYDDEPMDRCQAYLFDRNTKLWYKFDGTRWINLISRPPKPTGIWAGIGSRDLDYLSRIEIRKLLGTYSSDRAIEFLHPIVEEPKVDDIIYVPSQAIPGKGSLNREGGWATVRRITTDANHTYVSVGEFFDGGEFQWSELAPIQIELRDKFQNKRAFSKPDYNPENNYLL